MISLKLLNKGVAVSPEPIVEVDTPQSLIEKYRENAAVVRASRRGKITLEDVFIGLTGETVRS